MHDFVQHSEASGLWNLLAIDTDHRKRRPQQRHATQLSKRHLAELKNQDTQVFDRRAPRRPCPPFIRPVPLLVYRKLGSSSQPRANFDRLLIKSGTQRKLWNRLSKLPRQVKRVLAPGEHLPQRKPQLGRLMAGDNIRQPPVFRRKRRQLGRPRQKENAQRTMEEVGQLLYLAQRRLALARLPCFQSLLLDVQALGHPE